ncbi:hypothetical protein V5N11_033028 [Cardamine amara subsp. amara]|uniref:Uncharacterized protein n=1 Tax=Cardamine amara subsp. amara TaxID=228776 RepID=A0ABD1BGZ7_CARAN
MRRQGNFAESPASAYGAGHIHNSHSDFQGQLEAFTPERDQPYSDSQPEGQWRWERDGPNMSRPMATPIYNEGQGSDSRAQPQHQENPKTGYDNNRGMQTFEGLEHKF